MLYPGLYEQVINNALNRELAEIPEARKSTAPIDMAEAAKVLAQYLTDVVQKGLENVQDNGGGIEAQIQLANQIVTTIQNTTQEADFAALGVDQRAEQLLALLQQNDPRLATGKSAKDLDRPETSISQSSLFTGAIHEPQMYTELKKEIVSADRIDMLVSFIKWSGLRLIMGELRQFAQSGGELRIITTSYMGATDVKAIEELRALPNTKIKVSYDTKRTRLHAKTYVFYRDTGFTTAYVGSSNLSNAAISSGLEWNVKVTRKDLPETIEKITATFESYWNSSEFEYYDEGQRERLTRALKAEKYSEADHSGIYTLDILPYSYQQEILDRLDAERTVRGYNRNLVVAATGTGKTVISALDYKRFCRQHPGQPCRLLFVAHREEILKQSLYTFRAVLKDANFGELYVGSYKADSIDHLFVSIQTFNSQELAAKTAADFYDYIIVDEFHHAAAPTYQKLLAEVGLTEQQMGYITYDSTSDAITAALGEPTLLGKIMAASLLGAASVGAFSLRESRDDEKVTTESCEEIPMTTITESWKFKKTAGSMPRFGTVAGLALPPALALDYMYNKWRYGDMADVKAEQPGISGMALKAGRFVKEHPVLTTIGSGLIGSQMLRMPRFGRRIVPPVTMKRQA